MINTATKTFVSKLILVLSTVIGGRGWKGATCDGGDGDASRNLEGVVLVLYIVENL